MVSQVSSLRLLLDPVQLYFPPLGGESSFYKKQPLRGGCGRAWPAPPVMHWPRAPPRSSQGGAVRTLFLVLLLNSDDADDWMDEIHKYFIGEASPQDGPNDPGPMAPAIVPSHTGLGYPV